MKTPDQEIIWRYIDGEGSPEERMALEARMRRDPELARTFIESRRLDIQLRKQTPEMPSMRFSGNVLDRLPALYRKKTFSAEPLLTARQLRTIIAATLGLAMTSLGFGGMAATDNFHSNKMSRLFGAFDGVLNQVGPEIFQWLSLLGMALTGLLVLDFFLQRWFGKPEESGTTSIR